MGVDPPCERTIATGELFQFRRNFLRNRPTAAAGCRHESTATSPAGAMARRTTTQRFGARNEVTQTGLTPSAELREPDLISSRSWT